MKKVVIIPTYNEIENIGPMIEKVFSLAEAFEILVIDDGSPDGTAQAVKEYMSREPYAGRLHLVEREGKQGLGTAYIAGFRWALENGYDYIFEMDADFSHNPDDLPRLYEACHTDGADVAIGSRYVSGANVINWPISRILMSYLASTYARWVLATRIMDFTAGFICYRAEVLRTIDLDRIEMKGYGFQIEMKYTARRLKFNVTEVPIIFVDRTRGQSKMSSGIFGEAFWGVIKLRFRKIKGRKEA